MARQIKAEAAQTSSNPPLTLSLSLLSSANKSQCEEKRKGEEERFKMPSSKDGEEAQSSISSDGSREQPLTVQTKNNICASPIPLSFDNSWPMENIVNPGIHDCLMGRGGGTNHHPGNKRYRAITEAKKPKYLASKRLDKPLVAMEVINEWRVLNPMGRFLKQNQETKLWYDVGDRKAREKTSQALREKISYLVDDSDKSEGIGGNAAGEQIPGAKHLTDPCEEKQSANDASSLQPLKKGVWTEDEMQRVRNARKEFGNKWSDVAKRVPGRSEMSVKNWWYNHQTSEKRKRKRQDGDNRRILVAKYNHALIPGPKNHQGQHNGNIDSLASYTGEEEISPRTVISGSPGAVASSDTVIMAGGLNGYKIVAPSGEDGCEFGAIGYTFRRQLEDKTGQDMGCFDGVVVDILCGTDKNRRCLYYAIGFVEDLSMVDLKELTQLGKVQN